MNATLIANVMFANGISLIIVGLVWGLIEYGKSN